MDGAKDDGISEQEFRLTGRSSEDGPADAR
jgi:hypothetical protein